VWESTVGGRPLKFHLAGINNQNFIMRDEETGSWWQQVSGEAIQGPLKGARLNPVSHDELSFGVWKREQPQGRLLKPDPLVASQYESEDWEERYANLRVVVPVDAADRLSPRALVIGIKSNGAAKAYPFADLEKQSPIIDRLGGVPLLIVLGEDRKSVRAFDRSIEGRTLEFFVRPDSRPLERPLELIDAETGTIWDFTGSAVKGRLAGRRLKQVPVLKDYWFDWKIYNPKTSIYTLGEREIDRKEAPRR
jgi:Protein of unknown function (DUF3179)